MSNMDRYTKFIAEQVRGRLAAGTSPVTEEVDGYSLKPSTSASDQGRNIFHVIRKSDKKKIGAVGTSGARGKHTSWTFHPSSRAHHATESHFAHDSQDAAVKHVIKRYQEREGGSKQQPDTFK